MERFILSLQLRKMVIVFYSRCYTVSEIQRLREENISISLQSLHNLLQKFLDAMQRKSSQRRITAEMRAATEEMYNRNDELTSTRIRCLLTERWPDLQVSISTIKCTWKEMGWVCTRPHYCQLLCHFNKRKRMIWCQEQLRKKEEFQNAIITNKSTI